jgi:hypothetical protein
MLACARTRLVRCDANDVLCPGEALTVKATTGKAWPRSWSAVLAWALGVLTLLGLGATVWFDWLLRQAGRPDLTQLDAYVIPWLPAAAIAATVGAVVASRRPRHPVGWLLVGVGLSVAADGVTEGYARYGLLARPGALPAADWVAVYSLAMFFLTLVCIGFTLLLTPSGSLPSPRWRWSARAAVANAVMFVLAQTFGPVMLWPYESVAKPLAVPALAGVLDLLTGVTYGIATIGVAVGAGSLVVRFRRARGVERQQLRWVAFGAALTAMAALVALAGVAVDATVGGAVAGATLLGNPLFLTAAGLCIAVLPLATGAAILRYRLYDLDRIISRTLAYGLLTVLLGLGYGAVVLGLGRLLPDSSSLTVAAATLAVAAAFQPARRPFQQAVDRRFNRRRYDVARTIGAFSTRLRDQLDLDTLATELLAVVDQTMEPTQISLWLRPATHGSSGTAPARHSHYLGLLRQPLVPPAGSHRLTANRLRSHHGAFTPPAVSATPASGR